MLSLPSFRFVRQNIPALFIKVHLLKHTATVKEVLPTLSLMVLIPLSFTIREDISALYAAKCFLKKTFAMPGRRISKYTILRVMNMLKDPRVTFAMAAKEASVSVTTAEHIFDAHAGISSMPLPAILCMDEVYAVKYHQKVYACVLADFKSSQVYDLLPDRKKYTLAKYFSSISRDTRKTVKYVFNRSHADRPDEARSAPDALISEYKSSGYTIFEEVAKALSTYKQAVINSFTVIERTDSKGHTIRSRLSNGPMESLNRVPKDMKRHARGYSNFEHIRNRFLFAMRKNAPILASPRSYEQVRQPAGSKRCSYKP